LEIRDLSLSFATRAGNVRILDRVCLSVGRDEMVGLVGESGSGKTVSALATVGFLPPAAHVESGQILFEGTDILRLDRAAMRAIRGRRVAMVFQSSRGALNPLIRIGEQLSRVYRLQEGLSPARAREEAVAMLRRVGIADAERRVRAYPHQISGGMAQRVLLAMMLACKPALLIADEPTTGLDVTIQAQIFELLKDIRARSGASVLLITHDLGVVAETCSRMVVMYAGQVMETGDCVSIFARPRHPYTRHLLRSVLRVDRAREAPVMGSQPNESVLYSAAGCRFAHRCPIVIDICRQSVPAVRGENGRRVMCHRDGEEDGAAAEG
jgi:peptide/nickel transport system ATP-binding protein